MGGGQKDIIPLEVYERTVCFTRESRINHEDTNHTPPPPFQAFAPFAAAAYQILSQLIQHAQSRSDENVAATDNAVSFSFAQTQSSSPSILMFQLPPLLIRLSLSDPSLPWSGFGIGQDGRMPVRLV